ncbi:phosphotransferase [Devosia sp.]|uniref:phosphotransferase n=1 Tax=Devosia sp. TaxID=1871048 RepID=UPI003265DEEE
MASLALFAAAIGASFPSEFLSVYSAPLAGSVAWSSPDWVLIAYLTLPVLAIVVFAALTGFNVLARFRGALRWVTRTENFVTAPAELLPVNFGSDVHYEAFLDRRFRGDGGLLLEFEERGIGKGLLHRVFHGGSGAITALIEIDGQLLVRKFASGSAGQTLLAQYDWIERFAPDLPVVQTMGRRSDNGDQLYDMRYLGGTRDFYEAIHTETLVASAAILGDVVARLDAFHASHAAADAPDAAVRDYLQRKASANLNQVIAALPELFEAPSIEINGRPFALASLEVFRQLDWLVGKLNQRRQADIHGDLTIENIMVRPEPGPANWFLIDPNPHNGFQSPLIDFAKLMQSLHLGYEAVHRDPRASFANGKLTVSLHRSSQYSALFAGLCDDLRQRFGEAGLQQVLLHEMINYLRLIPYQLRRSPTAGTAFFGCLCILLQDYQERYPGDLPA